MKILLLVFLHFAIFCCYSCLGCLEEERIGLLTLKASINNSYGNSLPSWQEKNDSSPELDCCLWEGVICETISGRVIRLDLNHTWRFSFVDEYGYLNLSLFLPFEHLNSLHLSHNQIGGFIVDKDFRKLSSSKLRNLEKLDLSDNKLNETIGNIFSSLSSFLSLKSLDLSDNDLISNNNNNNSFDNMLWLNKFEVLDLSWNRMLGKNVLTFLGASDFSSLTSLDLSGIGLEGAIQTQSFNNLINLKKLDLSVNQIETLVPNKGVGKNLSNLKILDLSFNNFKGKSYDVFTLLKVNGFSSIKFLDVRNSNLEGSINVEDLNALNNLEELDISGNNIDKFVGHNYEDEAGLHKWSKLQVLRMDHMNCANGSILIQSMGPIFKSLKSLSLYVYGTLIKAQDFSNWTFNNLEELVLDDNQVDNNFLQRIGSRVDLTSLKMISLSYCSFSGNLSPHQGGGGLCELNKLEELYVDGNEIQGALPSCMRNLTSLQVFDISHNLLSGNVALSPIATHLTSLEILSISYNFGLEVSDSFVSFANHSKLRVFRSSNIQLSVKDNWEKMRVVPKFQLRYFSMINCLWRSRQYMNNIGSLGFLYYQYDLRHIDLSSNKIGGMFPSWLMENNTRLIGVYLPGNSFIGPLHLPSRPNPRMLAIDISNNEITGHIPSNISLVFPKLVSLNIAKNALEGQIPSCICDLHSFSQLDLSGNNLSGGIRDQFSIGCSGLVILDLSNNHLSGQLFSPIPYYLTYLFVDGNKFDGNIPRWLGNSYLRTIDLSTNNFSGTIPTEMCKFEFLSDLYLSNNNLSGYLPSCLPRRTRRFQVSKNRLTGSLMSMQDAFKNRSYLVMLDLSDNNFRGSLPIWIANITSLTVLLLNFNHFHGDIPIELCSLKSLSILDLSHNDFSGPILPCLGGVNFQAANIDTSDVNYGFGSRSSADTRKEGYENDLNGITLSVPLSIHVKVDIRVKRSFLSYTGRILNYMSALDLSNNQLTGQIPIELGNLTQLRALNLSNNHLNGPIPVTFSRLSNVESLDISNNNLSGKIPPELKELTFMGTFSVAYNNLSGPIPFGAQFGTFDVTSYEGNKLLCGPPLHNSYAKLSKRQDEDEDEEEDDGLIDMDFFYVSFLVSYVAVLLVIVIVLWINPYWRRAWFYFIGECMYSCYYFVLDTFSKLFKSK